MTNDFFTVRFTEPPIGLVIKVEVIQHNNDPNDGEKGHNDASAGVGASTRRRRESCCLDPSSPVFDADDERSLEYEVDRFVAAQVLQPGDEVTRISSCRDPNHLLPKRTKTLMNPDLYPLDLRVSRISESDRFSTPSPAKKQKQKQQKNKNDEWEVICLCASSSEDEPENELQKEKQPTVSSQSLLGPLTGVNSSVSAAFDFASSKACPDREPKFQPKSWVLTPIGPGQVTRYHRVERYSNPNFILTGKIVYKVRLEFGKAYMLEDNLQLLSESIYGRQKVYGGLRNVDVVRLWPGVYVNDAIIQFALDQLRSQIHDSIYLYSPYFYGRIASNARKRTEVWDSVLKWTKHVDWNKKELLVIPVVDNMHWSFVVVHIPDRIMYHFDSGKRFKLHVNKTIVSRINRYLKEALKMEQEYKGMTLKVPQQNNISDCGLYMMEMMERVLRTYPGFDFGSIRKDWFPHTAVARKRTDLRQLLYDLRTKTETNADAQTPSE